MNTIEMSSVGGPGGRTPASDETESLFSMRPIGSFIGYARRALRRQPMAALLAILAFGSALALVLLSSPDSYSSRVSLLVRDDPSLRQTVSARASDQSALLTSSVAATIKSRDSLDAIIDGAELLDRDPSLPFFGRLKKGVSELFFGTPSETKRREAMRADLKDAISVGVSADQTTVDIAVLWPDANQALLIAQQAEQSFLDSRHDIEVGSLEEAVDILQGEVTTANTSVSKLRESLNLSASADVPVGSALELAVAQQRQAQDQLTEARLLLEAERASFKYRYTEIEPAELPIKPIGSRLISVAVTLLLTLIMAALFCVAREALSNRIWEPGQLARHRLPVLADLTPRR